MKEIRRFTDGVMKDMGKRIQVIRKKRGVKAIDFADIIGIGKDQLSRIENGKVPCKTEHLFVISHVLEVSVDYIMFGKSENKIDSEMDYILGIMSDVQKDKMAKIAKILIEDGKGR